MLASGSIKNSSPGSTITNGTSEMAQNVSCIQPCVCHGYPRDVTVAFEAPGIVPVKARAIWSGVQKYQLFQRSCVQRTSWYDLFYLQCIYFYSFLATEFFTSSLQYRWDIARVRSICLYQILLITIERPPYL